MIATSIRRYCRSASSLEEIKGLYKRYVLGRFRKRHQFIGVASEPLKIVDLQPLESARASDDHADASQQGSGYPVERRELRLNTGDEAVPGGGLHPKGPTTTKSGICQGSSIQLRQSTLTIDGAQPADSNTIWDNLFARFWLWSLWPGPSRYWHIAWIAVPYFLRSLRGCRPTLFILVIAMDEAVHDLEILRRISQTTKLVRIHFVGLDTEVSCDKIHTAIKRLYDESAKVVGCELLILLTGHGDGDNRMHLHEGDFIDETNLYRLFESLRRQNAHPNPVHITIMFDFCRESEQTSAEPPEGVSLIWSCSPGENACAFRLPRNPAVPHSCFLLALMMSSHQPHLVYTGEAFKSGVNEHLNKLSVYLQKLHSLIHCNESCRLCSQLDQLCKEPQQNIDWRNAKSMNGALMLAVALLDTEVVREVYRNLVMSPSFRASNNLQPIARVYLAGKPEAWLATYPDLSNVPKDRTSGHVRGVNEAVHVA